MKLLTGNSNKVLSKNIAKYLKTKIVNSSIRKFSVIEKKVKAWIIEIKYNDSNLENIRNKLIENGYKLNNNQVKMIISIGPFTAISHAKEESTKLNKILGIDNKVSSFIF